MRIDALVSRIARFYDIDKGKKPSYRLQRGYYDDGIIQYPYAFEIIAIPLIEPHRRRTEFIGAVNYSISPNNINFECEFEYNIGDGKTIKDDVNMMQILEDYGGFHQHSNLKSRLSCIIVGNLITPRRDPHGYDKSRLDTRPFVETIKTAVKKVALSIQTFHAAGYVKESKADDYRNARYNTNDANTKITVKEALRQFLMEKRGLSS
jgi:hypothetical protein